MLLFDVSLDFWLLLGLLPLSELFFRPLPSFVSFVQETIVKGNIALSELSTKTFLILFIISFLMNLYYFFIIK
ncbi:Hypothetical protein MCYN_0576 [Mycoplasmopsis cynos C142]|uniref:Uncharacterized protein n=1 Tax=Mycoplasmopsis cynos (strain C142) TaxID=1246955 RepID=L0RUR7_MYCC1|nr:Hypothetical protein MCYN_0576 [Mycoplasmopsis cynos C142]